MSKVLIDACGWTAIIEGGLNVDLAMIQEKTTSPLLIDFLKSRSELIDGPEEASHPDDQLVIIASQENWPVLTVDRKLKQRLVEMNCSYIEVMSGQNLRLVSI